MLAAQIFAEVAFILAATIRFLCASLKIYP
jgi:hypothetical protein